MRTVRAAAAAVFISTSALAQGVTVRGVVYDSVHSRPLGGAFVAIGAKMATSDSAGRFIIADVLPGRYLITAQHDVIDQLGISAIGSQIQIAEGQRDPVTIALPSFRTLWGQVCGPTAPAADTGFVFGTVRAARNATVFASWIDIIADGTKISQKQKTMEVSADSLGNYALCGVPTTTGLTIRAIADSISSGAYDLPPMDKERVVRRDITVGQRRGSIAGKVLADSNKGPIANAELMLTSLGVSTTTNDRGEYSFTQLPAGSHRLYVRKIGYAEIDIALELGEAEQSKRDVVMNRVTILDSMQVKGKRLARDEGIRAFEENRRLGLGTFLTEADLDKANGRSLPQMMVMFPQLRITQLPDGRYVPSFIGRGPRSLIPSSACRPVVFVDGVVERLPDLNAFPVHVIAGVEYYRGAAQTPPEYARMGSGCGVIAIHLRKK